MKLARLLDPKLQSTLDRLTKESLPLKTAFKLKGIKKTVEAELNKYEEVRQEGLQKHGDKNEDGSLVMDEKGMVQFQPDKLQAFAVELSELTSMDIEIQTLSVDELGNVNITVQELEALEGLIL